jgi:hypothetical protein
MRAVGITASMKFARDAETATQVFWSPDSRSVGFFRTRPALPCGGRGRTITRDLSSDNSNGRRCVGEERNDRVLSTSRRHTL